MAKKKKGLTDKQKTFCDNYLLCMNASEAARQAGYSEKTACKIGSENLQKPDIQAYIKVRRDQTEEICQISKQKMLNSLETVRLRSLEPSIVRDMWGNPVMMEVELPRDKSEPDGPKKKETVRAVIVRDNPKAVISAVDQIAKYQGYHTPIKTEEVGETALSKLSKKMFGTVEV